MKNPGLVLNTRWRTQGSAGWVEYWICKKKAIIIENEVDEYAPVGETLRTLLDDTIDLDYVFKFTHPQFTQASI